MMNKNTPLLDWAYEITPRPSIRLFNFLATVQRVYPTLGNLMDEDPEKLLRFKNVGIVTVKELCNILGKPFGQDKSPEKDKNVCHIHITIQFPPHVSMEVNGKTI